MQALSTKTPQHNLHPLSKRLKLKTHAAHERVDQAIMALSPFASLEGYKRFLRVQYQFQRHTAPLYEQPELIELFEGLPQRCRYEAIQRDGKDLSLDLTITELDSVTPPTISSQAAALGWLYVNEGSNLGAAFLLKYAAQLGLSTNYGARHLAPSEDGRGLHWRNFVAQLDAVPLTDEQLTQAVTAAGDAFRFVETLAHRAQDASN
ncbi:biliverdin-producing heme oxygenase [Vreelandella olivaria]|uniref:biliverdin-producing heme oxygenase n=1 Tax=Vreelandella olivaria TaxID=390919 RepID=UPI00201EA52E|nr:biliverdin-producing heme oxygenase [Halomonas olivaria]